MESCLAEMRRNAALRELAFIANVADVPKPWNISRFEEVLGEPMHLTLLREMFEQFLRKLGLVVPDLGRHTAGDSSCLSARGDSKEACKHDGAPGAGPVDLIGTVFARPPGVPVRQPDVQSPAQLQSQPRNGPTLSQPGLFKPDSPLWNSYI